MSNQITLLEIYKTYLNDIHKEKSNQTQITNYILIIYSAIYFIIFSNNIKYELPKNISCILIAMTAIFGIFFLCKTQIKIYKSRKMILQLKKERWEFTQFLDTKNNNSTEGFFKLGFMIFLIMIGAAILFKIILNFDKILFFFTSTLLIFAICTLFTISIISFIKIVTKMKIV